MKKVDENVRERFQRLIQIILDRGKTIPDKVLFSGDLAPDAICEITRLFEEDSPTIPPRRPVGGRFVAGHYDLQWVLCEDSRIKYEILRRLPRLALKDAAHYINVRLERKWQNPISALESNIYRGKIKLSAHGQKRGKRTFTVRELDRFIQAKNSSPTPLGGQARKDLSAYRDLFGYYSDTHIAKQAGCSSSTIVRYRERNNIQNVREAAQSRIESIRDRLGQEPAGKLADEIRVNRMTITKYMQRHNIPAYARKTGPESGKPSKG